MGRYTDSSGSHGFLLNAQGFTTLDVPRSHFTSPSGINNVGQIVGNYDAGGFLLSGGVYTTINPYAGFGSTVLRGINASGQIVGDPVLSLVFASSPSSGRLSTPIAIIEKHL